MPVAMTKQRVRYYNTFDSNTLLIARAFGIRLLARVFDYPLVHSMLGTRRSCICCSWPANLPATWSPASPVPSQHGAPKSLAASNFPLATVERLCPCVYASIEERVEGSLEEMAEMGFFTVERELWGTILFAAV